MQLEFIASLASDALTWPLVFLAWFVGLVPFVALVEYGTHRWIMHMANRLLDPKLEQLEAHGAHHSGENGHKFVDMPLRNCLLLATPVLLALAVWGFAVGPWSAVLAPAAAMLTWCFVYTYLWTRLHRAIHGVEQNWFGRSGPLFRFFRNHHLRHHVNEGVNYGTVFPWTDYVFFTWHRRKRRRASQTNAEHIRAEPAAVEALDD